MSSSEVTETVKSGHPDTPAGNNVIRIKGTKLTQERRRTLKLMDSLPRGITIGQFKDGRKKSFYVRYGRPRKTEAFEPEVDRNDKADELANVKETHGATAINFDPKEWKEFQQWKSGRRTAISIKDAVPKYLGFRLAEDLVEDSDAYSHVELHLNRYAEKFGARSMEAGVTADELREWLPTIVSPRTKKPIGKLTQNHHRKEINLFYKRAMAEKWCSENPCALVRRHKIAEEEKTPLKPKEVFDLLKANREQKVIGRVCLELFGGLRASSAARLQKTDLGFDRKGIRMPGSRWNEETERMDQNHKSGKTKYRQGHPGVLWDWLKHAPEACWTEVSIKNYDYLKGHAFIRANVKNPGNVLRDSFVSYMLADTKNFQLVGYLAQHTRASTTEGYEGIVDEADAKLVMAMTPAAVMLEWDQFLASQTPKPTK